MKKPEEKKERYRRYGAKFKERAVERMRGGENISALSRELGVRRNQLYRWQEAKQAGRSFRERGRPTQSPAVGLSATGERQIADLHRLVGQLTEENRFFKGALRRIEELRQRNNEAGGKGSASKSGSPAHRKAN